jgi:hypothetical protein
MFMRISSFGAMLLIAGCSGEPDVPTKAEVREGAKGDNGIACALGGAATFAPICAVEQNPSAEGLILTVQHPDGGFRRLQVTGDGRGVITADGADSAIVTPVDAKLIEVAIGGDRYRLPATVKR